jgi:beta-lactamase superfamily II metal-dependent hydrolase
MNCEIEFLPVGDASRAGDAIVVRYGESNAFRLMLIDGGTTETGEQIVSHLRAEFGPNVTLAHVLLTHSDSDHASGLRTVLEQIPVANVWLHMPWRHASECLPLFRDKRWTVAGLERELRTQYSIIDEIVTFAQRQGAIVTSPEQGARVGPFVVLSPNRSIYNYLLPQFDKTPEADQDAIAAVNMWIGKADPLRRLLERAIRVAERWTTETWANERLRDGGRTSASNESSVVLYSDLGPGKRALLTGDAGIHALTWAHNYARINGYLLQQFNFVQIPHHGSRRNVGPTILDALLGPRLPAPINRFAAFVSAPKDDSSHPRQIVLNAFMRRGGNVIATQGQKKVHWGGFPPRAGYVGAQSLQFSERVEDYD